MTTKQKKRAARTLARVVDRKFKKRIKKAVATVMVGAAILSAPVTTHDVVKQTKNLVLYSPHQAQLAVHKSSARYNVVAFGRQAGKSTYGNNKVLKAAWENPGTTYWFISPTFDQAKKQYRRLVGMLSPCWDVLLKKNQTELRVKLINQSVVEFKSGEVFDNLRGETLHGCVIDEVREQPKGLWALVIRPMLATTKGWCDFISTPNGFDSFYDLAEKAKADVTGKWAFFTAPSTANPLFTQEEYEAAKDDMSEAEFDQEINAEFRNIFSGRAYSSETTANRMIFSPFCQGKEETVSKWLPVTVGLDFNVNPMSWHLGQFRNETSYWFDEIHVANTNTEECAKELVTRLIELRDRGVLTDSSPQVRLCGDATGNSRRTSATQSDYDLICQALDDNKITWTNGTPEGNPPVKQRVNTMNTRLMSASGVITLYYHPGKCPKLLRDFERVAWKEGVAELEGKKDKTLTHASDSVGYPVCIYSPIELSGAVGTVWVIENNN